ncbi:SDR family oxidoreductase [Paenibacillus sp. LHD-117]|uniref:SDR family NAD(P)-dependent oxidoreductase n=1 Tax=Paenibacillus sp. LHD-117 TaxID=3071412 RepID=UPI0027E157BB|nr:SDR family oxidoreductase [Paenibacillus sp. LHD-117]MDQ6419106.1 SDR family oxidoreductase [Paenibacillus sp. LHD-117]
MSRKVVFITDADGASGDALIARFGEPDTDLLLASRQENKAWEQRLAPFRSAGSQVLVVQVDLCSGRELAAMLDQAERELGAVDVMIHNAHLVRPALVESCEEETFTETMNALAKSAFLCTQAVGKRMAAKGRGSIVFAGSIHSEKPAGSAFPFSAAQGAVKMLAREAALFLGRHGIRVNYIESGPLDGSEAGFGGELSGVYDSYNYKVPAERLGSSRDMAELAYFLSKDGAGFVNGADIRLDGGFVLHYMDHRMKKPTEGDTRLS